MNDSEFIELLNLYVDQEISVADAARLEAEVLQNPSRRRTYQEYCRIQKACKLLATDFVTQPAPVPADNVVAFATGSERSARFGQYAALGAFAAAACLAIVFVNRSRDLTGSSTAPFAQTERQPAPVADRGASRGIVHAVSVPMAQPTLVRNPLLLSGRVQSDAVLAAAVEQANNQFEWMRTVQLTPLQQRLPMEIFRFDTPPVPLDDGRTYHSPQSGQMPVESVGFRFNK